MEHAIFAGIATKEALPVNRNVVAVGDTEVITRSTYGSFVFVPLGCPPYRCLRQHLFEPRLATYVLYMARTRDVHSHGKF